MATARIVDARQHCEYPAEPVLLPDTWVDPKWRTEETYGEGIAALSTAVKIQSLPRGVLKWGQRLTRIPQAEQV